MKMKKLNFKKVFITLVLMIVVFFVSPKIVYYLTTTETQRSLYQLNYQKACTEEIISNERDQYLIEKQIYSPTINEACNQKEYKDKFFDNYLEITYVNNENFILKINKLLELNYSAKEINQIYQTLSDEQIDEITNKDKIDNLTTLISQKFFNFNNLERYSNYQKKEKLNVQETVLYVELDLDIPFYTTGYKSNLKDEYLILTNKYYALSKNYEPNDLVKINTAYTNGKARTIRKKVNEAFEKMAKAMTSQGMMVNVVSAYRSYATQNQLYNNYANRDGIKKADTYSARPGHSEHQTGLALDLNSLSNSAFVYTKEYKWLKDNAHKYGFILRYPSDKVHITGYMFESWHYRYVGNEVATYIYENKITFEEYYLEFIK